MTLDEIHKMTHEALTLEREYDLRRELANLDRDMQGRLFALRLLPNNRTADKCGDCDHDIQG